MLTGRKTVTLYLFNTCKNESISLIISISCGCVPAKICSSNFGSYASSAFCVGPVLNADPSTISISLDLSLLIFNSSMLLSFGKYKKSSTNVKLLNMNLSFFRGDKISQWMSCINLSRSSYWFFVFTHLFPLRDPTW